ncbi:hypothetical protein BEP19_12095 [Ammoniphilus oxalaticus]|uniref:ATP-grasp domain-containing protein n=1 Tax=Ammoniphilus oxalaticus TaxID=66863 RepID=A0A419SGV6_9BACL|nr:YheC/YheD family protein [Ammoniphilus oxalaticus]RKD22965.1 hypothetical protein BEP19_12095 [Ammoniphilus oxalaticus]
MKTILGILVHRITDPHRYDPTRKIAIESGFDEVLVYTPPDVNLKQTTIHGYVYVNKEWIKQTEPFPSITYDIGYYNEPALMQKMRQMKRLRSLPLIGYSIGSKWTIHRHLAQARLLRPFLIPTQLANDTRPILNMIQKSHSVMVKPLNGSGGKGIFRITKKEDNYELSDHLQTTPITLSRSELEQRLSKTLRKQRYLVQKWIDIRDKHDCVFDIRAFMQKNRHGQWQMTGIGVRQGKEETMTSNLSGGGQAHHVQPFLRKQYDESTADALYRKLVRLSEYIPPFLERSYNTRLAELGLDLAIDRQQQIWIIEVNIKPGKTLMRKLGHFDTDHEALRAPIEYARFLVDRFHKQRR